MSLDARMILVDTNVWLDNYLPNRKGHDDARRFLARATVTAFTPADMAMYLETKLNLQ